MEPIEVVDDPQRYTAAYAQLDNGVGRHPGWKAAFDAYGLRSHWLVAQRVDRPAGLLPLVRQSSLVFGRRLASLPWLDVAGAVGDADAVAALARHAIGLAASAGRGCELVLKQPLEAASPTATGWRTTGDDKALLRRALPADPDQLWTELPAKVRNQVRKGEKEGLTTDWGGSELLDGFFGVYATNMRDLGSPSHSRRFFAAVMSGLTDRARLCVARFEGRVVGAGLVLDNRPSLDIPWASSDRAFNHLCVNHALYWRILSDACREGYAWFNFGRSTLGSGQHRFKKQWGATAEPLAWYSASSPQMCGPGPLPPPDSNAEKSCADGDTGAFGLARRLWTRLPVGVAQRIGPLVIRNVQ